MVSYRVIFILVPIYPVRALKVSSSAELPY